MAEELPTPAEDEEMIGIHIVNVLSTEYLAEVMTDVLEVEETQAPAPGVHITLDVGQTREREFTVLKVTTMQLDDPPTVAELLAMIANLIWTGHHVPKEAQE